MDRAARSDSARTAVDDFRDFAWPSNPKNSLFWSIATGCVPGMIEGVQKLREVECNYALCMLNSGANNITLMECEASHNFQQCYFVVGEIFQLLPIQAINDVSDYVQTVLSDPLALLLGVTDLLCEAFVVVHSYLYIGCVVSGLISQGADLVLSIQNFIDNAETMFEPEQDSCQRLKEITG
tara:strand:- start:145 stop:687 length:543 start_codon:yes stop_codon:yes gene_type:complete